MVRLVNGIYRGEKFIELVLDGVTGIKDPSMHLRRLNNSEQK